MGTDNLFHKRRSKSIQGLQRKKSVREAYDKVLIVCEGGKTEPYYFNALRRHYGLHTANVAIHGECNSDPKSVFAFAHSRYHEAKNAGDAFDKVFCVFDKDAHDGYDETLTSIQKAKHSDRFVAINSVPSFEFWLLLHFTYTTRPFHALPGNSSGNQVLSELKKYLPDYKKGATDIFDKLLISQDFAKANAERAFSQAQASGTDNPTTQVHLLVSFLENLNK